MSAMDHWPPTFKRRSLPSRHDLAEPCQYHPPSTSTHRTATALRARRRFQAGGHWQTPISGSLRSGRKDRGAKPDASIKEQTERGVAGPIYRPAMSSQAPDSPIRRRPTTRLQSRHRIYATRHRRPVSASPLLSRTTTPMRAEASPSKKGIACHGHARFWALLDNSAPKSSRAWPDRMQSIGPCGL